MRRKDRSRVVVACCFVVFWSSTIFYCYEYPRSPALGERWQIAVPQYIWLFQLSSARKKERKRHSGQSFRLGSARMGRKVLNDENFQAGELKSWKLWRLRHHSTFPRVSMFAERGERRKHRKVTMPCCSVSVRPRHGRDTSFPRSGEATMMQHVPLEKRFIQMPST